MLSFNFVVLKNYPAEVDVFYTVEMLSILARWLRRLEQAPVYHQRRVH